MNFKKYHVSKNLLNIDRIRSDTFTLDTVYYLNGVAYDTLGMKPSTVTVQIHDNAITIQTSSYYGVGFVVPVEFGKTYHLTFNCDVSVPNFGGITQLTENGSIQKYSNIYSNSASVSITSTDTRYILIVLRCINQTAIFSNIMLNEGASAQPYEPYSSEVWHDIPHYIHNTSTDTLTTLPADIYANDVTATVGVKGNMEQSGTPTPTTPIQPQECGERTGNLFDGTIKNVSTSLGLRYGFILDKVGTYTIKITGTTQSGDYCYGQKYSNGSYSPNYYITLGYSVNNYNVTIDEGEHVIIFDASSNEPKDVAQSKFNRWKIMANTGSTPLPYEPYGYKIPILSNSVTTPVYLGEVPTTRQIKKLVLTGEENWVMSVLEGHNGFLTYAPQTQIGTINCICSHYKVLYSNTNNVIYFINNPINGRFVIFDDRYSSTDDFKTYLAQQYAAGTPVCVWYVIATETTGMVNEPLRKIGDYADEVSNVSIPTTAGANTIDVDTTLKPSEITATYKGWHPVMNGHESESGQWD